VAGIRPGRRGDMVGEQMSNHGPLDFVKSQLEAFLSAHDSAIVLAADEVVQLLHPERMDLAELCGLLAITSNDLTTSLGSQGLALRINGEVLQELGDIQSSEPSWTTTYALLQALERTQKDWIVATASNEPEGLQRQAYFGGDLIRCIGMAGVWLNMGLGGWAKRQQKSGRRRADVAADQSPLASAGHAGLELAVAVARLTTASSLRGGGGDE